MSVKHELSSTCFEYTWTSVIMNELTIGSIANLEAPIAEVVLTWRVTI
jgi:hypothetical protein